MGSASANSSFLVTPIRPSTTSTPISVSAPTSDTDSSTSNSAAVPPLGVIDLGEMERTLMKMDTKGVRDTTTATVITIEPDMRRMKTWRRRKSKGRGIAVVDQEGL